MDYLFGCRKKEILILLSSQHKGKKLFSYSIRFKFLGLIFSRGILS